MQHFHANPLCGGVEQGETRLAVGLGRSIRLKSWGVTFTNTDLACLEVLSNKDRRATHLRYFPVGGVLEETVSILRKWSDEQVGFCPLVGYK
jgi:hypothetical protein